MALLLDCMLTTCIVPIVPEILHKNDSDISIGFLLSAKSFFQLLAGVAVGPITDRIGFNVPMVSGFVLLTSSTIFFAFAPDIGQGSLSGTYAALVVGRSIEGIGCSLVTIAGMAMVADRYPDQQERGAIMGKVLGGVAIGVLIGYPFGGAFSAVPGGIQKGWKYPFLIIAAVGFLDLGLQLLILGSTVSKKLKEKKPSSMCRLIRDPYVIVALVLLFVSQLPISMMEPVVPAWMMSHFTEPKPEAWQIGLVFLASTLGYAIMTPLIGYVAPSQKWIATLLGMLVLTIGTVVLPLTKLLDGLNLYFILLPMTLIGIGIGMMESALYPTMSMLVDLRHSSVYGSIYALTDMAVNISFIAGPITSSLINQLLGFSETMWLLGGLCVMVAPFVICIKSPKPIPKQLQEIHDHPEDIELQDI
jgi:DHA1 family solute carrier family 18 vesicular amine transporter 1/2